MADPLSKSFFVTLSGRARVRITGADRFTFLQNLATNDLTLLERQPAVYSCFLTPQGKFLHDFFVTGDGEALVLDCEGGARANDLVKKIKPFRLRSKVEFAVEPDVKVYAVFGNETGYADPRHIELGFRTTEKPAGLEEKPFSEWDQRRIRLAIPDGSRDMAVEKDTVLECNIDKANGVSHQKGCYIGQEITARMYLRGLVKKHLYTVEIHGAALTPFSDITVNGQLAGQMRSHCGAIGMAMLKDENLPLPAEYPLKVQIEPAIS
jgi:folate-binding protein YgfZ